MYRKAAAKLAALTAVGLTALASSPAWASSAGMPWEGPIQKLVSSLTGPVAKGVGVFAIVGCGFGMAFSEGGSALRKVLWVGIGLAITFSAATWGLNFFGFSGGMSV
jgi:type IV secretory pathway VirB2 component (pilin)